MARPGPLSSGARCTASISASITPGINYGPAVAPRLARLATFAASALTFLAVVVAWVFFRADSIASALYVLSRMADPDQVAFGRTEIAHLAFIAIYAAHGVVGAEHAGDHGLRPRATGPVGENVGAWRDCVPAFLYATAAVLAFGILGIQQHSEFIYFRF